MAIDTSVWQAEYKKIINNPPKDGDILVSQDGSPVKLNVELKEGSPPFIFGRAYVPETVGSELDWFLQDEGMSSFHGWKCILMPRARSELMKRPEIVITETNAIVYVKSLKVVRKSHTNSSLLCEVHEYLPEEVVTEDVVTEDVVTEDVVTEDVVTEKE